MADKERGSKSHFRQAVRHFINWFNVSERLPQMIVDFAKEQNISEHRDVHCYKNLKEHLSYYCPVWINHLGDWDAETMNDTKTNNIIRNVLAEAHAKFIERNFVQKRWSLALSLLDIYVYAKKQKILKNKSDSPRELCVIIGRTVYATFVGITAKR